MVKFHLQDGRVFKLQLRESLSHIRSEKKFRDLIEKAIARHEQDHPTYGAALRQKWENDKELDVFAIFGVTTNKWKVS
jgi:hypothetical protein